MTLNELKMKNNIKILKNTTLALTVALLSACSFTEECDYTGNVNVLIDYEEFWKDMPKPEDFNIVFNSKKRDNDKRILKGDTTYTDMPSVGTDIWVYNKPEGVEFKNGDREVHLPTHFDGNTRYTQEAPMIAVYRGHVNVPIEDTERHIVSPRPVVKEIDMNITIDREGDVGEVAGVEAYLSGINTGYDLEKDEPIHSKGTVKFGLSKVVDSKKTHYRHRFFVFGVNTPKEGYERIPKKLLVSIRFKNGDVRTREIDISEQLDKLNTSRFECHVNVRITALSLDLTLVKWGQGAWGEVVL